MCIGIAKILNFLLFSANLCMVIIVHKYNRNKVMENENWDACSRRARSSSRLCGRAVGF